MLFHPQESLMYGQTPKTNHSSIEDRSFFSLRFLCVSKRVSRLSKNWRREICGLWNNYPFGQEKHSKYFYLIFKYPFFDLHVLVYGKHNAGEFTTLHLKCRLKKTIISQHVPPKIPKHPQGKKHHKSHQTVKKIIFKSAGSIQNICRLFPRVKPRAQGMATGRTWIGPNLKGSGLTNSNWYIYWLVSLIFFFKTIISYVPYFWFVYMFSYAFCREAFNLLVFVDGCFFEQFLCACVLALLFVSCFRRLFGVPSGKWQGLEGWLSLPKKKTGNGKMQKKLANSHFELKVMESWRFGSDDVPFHLRGDLFYVPC